MGNKCFICETKKVHKFKNCLSVECSCPCVEELKQMYTNNRVEDIKPVHPKFLHINNGEDKEIPSVDKEISRFTHIRKSEWIKIKRDKRRKR